MNPQEFEAYYQRWRGRIMGLARRLARGDRDLADDLAQEAFWKLAEFDLERVSQNEAGCIWRVIRDHMLNVRRREMRAKVIVPLAKRREASARRAIPYVQREGTHRARSAAAEPRHWGAAPVDGDDAETLWDDM